MKCIYKLISSLIIFKDETFVNNWIPEFISDDWHFLCNTKRWINNIHELQWLCQIFESSTREKVNEKSYLLIYDEYDNHITISWIIYYMKDNIIFMILSSHFSHLTQSLNIENFNPLKKLITSAIEPLISIELYHILKLKWLFAFIKTYDNIFSI